MTTQTQTVKRLTPQRDAFVTAYVMGASAADAARQAGYSKHTAKNQGSRLLANVDVVQAIERKRAVMQTKVEYSTADWIRDTLEIGAEARAAGAHGPALKAQELVGRHIGALTNERSVSREQAELFSYLGAAMERQRAELAQSSGQTVELPSSDADTSPK